MIVQREKITFFSHEHEHRFPFTASVQKLIFLMQQRVHIQKVTRSWTVLTIKTKQMYRAKT